MSRANGREIRREMEGLMREWKRSGETVRSFAAQKGMTSAKFFYWKKRLGFSGGSKRAGRSSRSQGFVPVQVVDNPEWGVARSVVLEVVLESGERVRFAEGASEEMLRSAIRVLRERC